MSQYNNIGKLNRRLKLFIPLTETTALGGEKITFQLWLETWTQVDNIGINSSERFSSDRETAFNSYKFTIRYRANIHEKMLIEFDGKQFDIINIVEKLDTPVKHYQVITATHKEDPVQVLANLEPQMIYQFAQKAENFSGTLFTITNGTLYNPGDYTENDLDNICHLYRSGLRQIYNKDFTISGSNIVFAVKLRGETVLYQQFKKQS